MVKHRNQLTKYWVVTPAYECVEVILDDGTGPVTYEHDVVEVEAYTKREAIILGVKKMKELRYKWFRYCNDNPYVGIKAYLSEN